MKPLHCLNCGCALAHTDQFKLQIANVYLYTRTALYCVGCGARRVWRPTVVEYTTKIVPILPARDVPVLPTTLMPSLQ